MFVSKALTDGWAVLRKNPLIFTPAIIISILSTYMNWIQIPMSQNISDTLNWLAVYIPTAIVVSLFTIFFSGMIIKMVYDSTRRKKPSLVVAAKFVLSRYIPLLLTSILYIVIIAAGAIAFIIPGIFLGISLVFYNYAVLIDEKGVSESLKKSWRIVKGHWWEVFAIVLIINLLSFLLGLAFGFLSMSYEAIMTVFNFITNLFTSAWYASSLTFAYLKLRKK